MSAPTLADVLTHFSLDFEGSFRLIPSDSESTSSSSQTEFNVNPLYIAFHSKVFHDMFSGGGMTENECRMAESTHELRCWFRTLAGGNGFTLRSLGIAVRLVDKFDCKWGRENLKKDIVSHMSQAPFACLDLAELLGHKDLVELAAAKTIGNPPQDEDLDGLTPDMLERLASTRSILNDRPELTGVLDTKRTYHASVMEHQNLAHASNALAHKTGGRFLLCGVDLTTELKIRLERRKQAIDCELCIDCLLSGAHQRNVVTK
ncbi:hypothetical protein MNV49_007890 [Pseudohyphozyma bogoriensis]|nr:hypothetical protein MNV49_007890 [Pseudohyphozyma bogoriensis]